MCTVSNIGDNFRNNFPNNYHWYDPNKTGNPPPYIPPTSVSPYTITKPLVDSRFLPTPPSREEFNKLKADVEALRELLKAAKIYDEKTGQKDCEADEKVEFIKLLAKYLDVDMKGVFE